MKASISQRRRTPSISLFYPNWWHGHGTKIKVRETDLRAKRLVFAASAASLEISPYAEKPGIEGWDWNVRWEVVQAHPNYKTVGLVVFSNEELAAAFCLADDPGIWGEYSQWMLDRFGGDCAVQGKFIRYTGFSAGITFLNIPCPGTGHDGDPNISLEVTEEIKKAVAQLLVPS